MRYAHLIACLSLSAGSAWSPDAVANHGLRADPLFRGGYETWTCGNGVVEDSEQCDAGNVDGEDCLTLGFLGGDLSCDGGCRFDTGQCISNRAPVAVNDQVITNEDTSVAIPIATLLANDVDPDLDTLSIIAVGNAINGVVSLGPGSVGFTPAPNFNGSASFEYTLSDGDLTDIGRVTVLVVAQNDPPVANAQAIVVSQNSSGNIVTLSGADIDSASVSFQIVTPPEHGSVGAINATGSFTAEVAYTPNAAYVGADSFSYRVFDGNLYSAAAVVSVDVVASATAGSPAQ